jgi:cell division protease FtsH
MNCAEATAAQVDEEVRTLMNDAYQEAIRILEENREMLDRIADYLLTKETITGQEMMAILEGRDPALVDNYGATPENGSKPSRDSDVEPPARSIHMISEAPTQPTAEENADEQVNVPDQSEETAPDQTADAQPSDSAENDGADEKN